MNETQKIEHLLRRAGFGATPEEIKEYRRIGLPATIEKLTNYERVPDDHDSLLEMIRDDLITFRDPNDLKAWMLFRMARTGRPLQEKMTLFWHDHFATSNRKVANGPNMFDQNELFRRHALGNFRDLLMGVAQDPAMIRYLDGNLNRKGKPNENLAREFLELFSLGIGNYTEKDIQEAARAFTGWNVRYNGETKSFRFFYNAKQHDEGEKEFLGTTGKLNGDDIVNTLAAHPRTAEFLARKLCRFFVAEEGHPELETLLAEQYRKSGFSIRAVVRKLFSSPLFYADDLVGKKIKSPVELVVGTLRALGERAHFKTVARLVTPLGQDLLYPPNVGGWKEGLDWFNTSTVVERMNLMKLVATGAGGQTSGVIHPYRLVREKGIRTPEQLVDYFLKQFGVISVKPTTRAKLVEYVLAKENDKMKPFPAGNAIDVKVRGVAHLVLCLPEYQVA